MFRGNRKVDTRLPTLRVTSAWATTSSNITRRLSFPICISVLVVASYLWTHISISFPSTVSRSFYANIRTHNAICASANGNAVSHSGYIGLSGDTEADPRRAFFWYFEAQDDAVHSPVILTIGGGPGTTGMINPMFGQSHCIMTANGTVPNPNAWTQHFNLVALDHPIGAGFSYGGMVNNSRAAALDAYDFLQKFFALYPHLAKNEFIISGGSYGGVYVPHIATVIHEQNRAIQAGSGPTGAVHINLESLMLSNPMSDPLSHYRWALHQRCVNFPVYNSTTCRELYAVLPSCLESIELALASHSVEWKVAAQNICNSIMEGDMHGTVPEDVRRKCYDNGDPLACHAEIVWINDFFHTPSVKEALGVPASVNFQPVNLALNHEFWKNGDRIQRAFLLYEPLLESGIRLLHYVGMQDANCGWPGVLSFLKLLHSKFQEEFLVAPDVPWPSKEDATVRVVGPGAGNMTFILLAEAGHFVVKDQPILVKAIVEHWVENRSFLR